MGESTVGVVGREAGMWVRKRRVWRRKGGGRAGRVGSGEREGGREVCVGGGGRRGECGEVVCGRGEEGGEGCGEVWKSGWGEVGERVG